MAVNSRFLFVFRMVLVLLVILSTLAPIAYPVLAASVLQDNDPVAQCAEGVRLFEAQKNVEALPFLEAGFSNRNRVTFAEPDDLGLCALILGNLYNLVGKQDEALQALLLASEVFRKSDNREYRYVALNSIGSVYHSQERYEQALEQYQYALELMQELGDRKSEGVVLNNIGLVYSSQKRYVESLEQFQWSLKIMRELGDRAGEGRALSNIGAVYDLQEHYDEALGQYQQALAIMREVGDQVGEGNILNSIGLVYNAQGRYDKALEQYQQALVIRREVGDRKGEGVMLNNIGVVYAAQGRYAEALNNHQQALVIIREASDLGMEGRILNNIGMVYRDQGQYAEALWQCQQALKIAREVGDREGEGITLNNIGLVYASQGKYAEALVQYQQALVIRREMGDRAGESTTLMNISAVYKGQGRDEGLEQYQQTLKIAREVGDRASEGTALNNIGLIYEGQGRYSEALEQYQQALKIAREIGNRAGESSTLNNMGVVYANQGQYAEALEQYQQALKLALEVGNREGESDVLNNIGSVYDNQGRYVEALDQYQRALKLAREVGDQEGEGITLNNIGSVYDNQGQYAEALEQYEQALVIAREVGNRAGEGYVLNNIGSVYQLQGRYADALEQYQQALVIAREVGNRTDEGTMLNNIGAIYNVQGRFTEALEQDQQALKIAREVGNRKGEGNALNSIGVVYDAQKRHADALGQYQQALAIMREVGDRKGEGITLNNIGAVYKNQGRYTDALAQYQQALVIMREVGNWAREGSILNNIGIMYEAQGRYAEALEQYQQALKIALEVGDREGESKTLMNIGAVYEAQGKEAEALSYNERATTAFDTLRSTAGSESARSNFIAQYALLYDHTIQLYYQQNQPDKALITSERGRARAFLDSLATGYVELNNNDADVLYQREREVYNSRQSAQDALAKAKAENPPDLALISDLEAQLVMTEEDYQTALSDISERNTFLEQLIPGRSKVLDLPQAQALLDNQTTLLSFWVLDDQTLVFILTKDTFNTVSLPISRIDLYAKIDAFRSFANKDVAYPDSSIELYKVLIEPLRIHLSRPNIVIVPHGKLHYLPFAALTNGKRYLVDDYTITYLPSISAWPYIKQNVGHTDGTPLIVGNPATGDGLKPLRFAESEAQAVANLYNITPLLGKNATEGAMRLQASQANILHLAAHGNYNSTNPLYSVIYLAPDDKNKDGLEVHEIYSLKLNKAEIVVLSACETQLGELSTGDEFVGMTRAFFFAGTPSVLASLWDVDDRSTQLLMENFYIHWKSGMSKADALKQAQIDVRSKYPNPYYWAGFVLSGDSGKKAETGSAVAQIFASLPVFLLVLFLCFTVLGVSVYFVSQRKKQLNISEYKAATTMKEEQIQHLEQSPAQSNPPTMIVMTQVVEISHPKPLIGDEIQKALASSQLGKHQESFDLLRQVIQAEPENAQAWLLIGFTLTKLGDIRTAERCFSRAKHLGHPQGGQALVWLRSIKQK